MYYDKKNIYMYIFLINNNLKILNILMKIIYYLNYCLNKFLIFLNIKKNISCKYLKKLN